jgi:hypothetical protein
MSRLSGVVLIVAGVGVAAYAVTWPSSPSVEAARPVQNGPTTQASANEPTKVATPSPAGLPKANTAAPAPVAPPAMNPAPGAPMMPPPSPVAKVAPSPAAKPAPAQIEPVVQVAPKIAAVQPAVTAGPPLDRTTLTTELQRQLRRVGCYEGDVNGVWTPVARRSMKAFTDRVNATLPVEQPDYILLAMVQGHQGQACGRACPNGQNLADDGRCLPTGIIAAAASKKRVADAAHGAGKAPMPAAKLGSTAGSAATEKTAAPSEPSPPALGRMALAGPKQEIEPPAKGLAGVPGTPQHGVRDKHEARRHHQPRRARYAQDGRLREFRPTDQGRSRLPSWVPWSRPWMFN